VSYYAIILSDCKGWNHGVIHNDCVYAFSLLQKPPMAMIDGIVELFATYFEITSVRTYHPLRRFPDYNWVKPWRIPKRS